jgi:hypothetical protein
MDIADETQRALAILLLVETGVSRISAAEAESLAALHARFAHDRALVTSLVRAEAEPAVLFNPASRAVSDERP